jgi:MOSC domain-containing protein YiiM
MRILSIQTGTVSPLTHTAHQSPVFSAIHKTTVSTLQKPLPISIHPLGLEHDEQADLSVHGGIDKAVYVYPFEHYEKWQAWQTTNNLASPFNLGQFGENLTIEGLLETDLWIGDLLNIGDAVCAVSQIRQPCFKFNIVMEHQLAAKHMIESGMTGWYLRVLQQGTVRAGDTITLQHGPRDIRLTEQIDRLQRKKRSI